MLSIHHELQPLVVPADVAHAEGYVRYSSDGQVHLRHPLLAEVTGHEERIIPTDRQYPSILATFTDLAKALSSRANSPRLASGRSLREEFEAEFELYRGLCERAESAGLWEPDYGSYVFDPVSERLHLIAPRYWHRVALTTSTGMLLRDPAATLHYQQVRERLESAAVGVVGVSVGSNVVEGLARELRPQRVKVADPDWIELNNLNRLERAALPDLVRPRSSRFDAKNSLEMHRYNKAAVVARSQQLVDPYATYFVYPEGLDSSNLDRFLLGDDAEPRLDLVIEEADDIGLKWQIRKRCRQLGIGVMMLTDFGHQAILHFQDFKKTPDLPLAFAATDEECERLLERAQTTGNRQDVFEFVRALLGPQCIRGEFKDWVDGLGEQPTSSLPQSGATALISGGIAGKAAALHLLGHDVPPRTIYDFAAHCVEH